MEERPKRRRGRPVGTTRPNYVAVRCVRLTTEDLETLGRLALRWKSSDSEAVRRAIRETAKREGVE